MKSRKSLIYILIFTVLVVVAGGAVLLNKAKDPPKMSAYVGPNAHVSVPDQTTDFQIDGAVLAIPPRLASNVQADIRVSSFTGSAAEGIATYSKSRGPIRFMVVKSNGKWIVIAHTTSKTLVLPNNATARKYSLPKGWYTNV